MKRLAVLIFFLAGTSVYDYANSLRPAKLDDLFKEADLVGMVKVVAGESQNHSSTIYKAEMLQVFKGMVESRFIYFGPYQGSEIGGEYLVFMKRTGEKLQSLRNEGVPADSPVFNPEAPYYLVMYEGYGKMESGYECIFEDNKGTPCDDAIRLYPEQILLPKKLKTYPGDDVDTLHPMNPRWVHRSHMTDYLSDLCRKANPDQCRLKRPVKDRTIPVNTTIRGLVTYPDGAPAEAADVTATLQCEFYGMSYRSKTDADGRFQIRMRETRPGCDSFEFAAEKRDTFWLKTSDHLFVPVDETVNTTVKYDPPNDPEPVAIQLRRQGAKLEVQVRDGVTGKFIESHVDIRRIDLPGSSASIHSRTELDGAGVLFFVPEGTYEVHASGSISYSASWTGVRRKVSLKAGEISHLVLELTPRP